MKKVFYNLRARSTSFLTRLYVRSTKPQIICLPVRNLRSSVRLSETSDHLFACQKPQIICPPVRNFRSSVRLSETSDHLSACQKLQIICLPVRNFRSSVLRICPHVDALYPWLPTKNPANSDYTAHLKHRLI